MALIWGLLFPWGLSDSYSQMVGGSGIRCWFSAGHQEWLLMQLAVSAGWVGPEAQLGCQPRHLDVVSPHGYSLPIEMASFQRDSQEEGPVSKHQEAQRKKQQLLTTQLSQKF